jgi:hypothetical protein
LPPAELIAEWDTIEVRLAQATHLAQLGLDDDAPESQPESQIPNPESHPESLPTYHIRCQPAVELHGRLADWVAEIRKLRQDGETTLFVAATAGRAERTIELLKEYEIFAVAIERADEARYAAVLVVLGNLSRGFRPRPACRSRRGRRVRRKNARAGRRRSAKGLSLRSPRSGRRPRRSHRPRHRHVRGPKQIGVGDSVQEFLELATRARTPIVPVERLDLVRSIRRGAPRRSPRRRAVGAREIRSRGHARHGRGARRMLRAEPCRVTPSAPTPTGSRSSRTPSIRAHARSEDAIADIKRARWNRNAHGPAVVRRRRLERPKWRCAERSKP